MSRQHESDTFGIAIQSTKVENILLDRSPTSRYPQYYQSWNSYIEVWSSWNNQNWCATFGTIIKIKNAKKHSLCTNFAARFPWGKLPNMPFVHDNTLLRLTSGARFSSHNTAPNLLLTATNCQHISYNSLPLENCHR